MVHTAGSSLPELIRAVKGNLNAYFRLLEDAASPQTTANANLFCWYQPIPHPWFTGMRASNLPSASDAEYIRSTLAEYKARGIDQASFWLEPDIAFNEWAAFLQPYHFTAVHEPPGMAVELHTLEQAHPVPPGLRIIKVDDKETFHIWNTTFAEGFEMPADWEKLFYDLAERLPSPPFHRFLGYLNDQPVATVSLFIGAGAGGIYNLATIPEARQRGIGSYLTHHALLEALKIGCRIGVLQAAEMGRGVYKRLGFKTICSMDHFIWQNDTDR